MQTGPMGQFERRTLDWRTSLRVAYQPPPDPRVAVVIYGDETEANLASWPPDRAVHADLISLLSAGQPAVISFDVILDAMRDGAGDAKLAQSAREAMAAGIGVVTGAVSDPDPGDQAQPVNGPTQPLPHVAGDIGRLLGNPYAIEPFPALRAVSWYGFVDAPPGPDGKRREIPLVVRVGGEVYPSLALQTLMAYYHVKADEVDVRLGEAITLAAKPKAIRVPVSDTGRFLLNYRYDQDELGQDFATYSYLEALSKQYTRYVEKNRFAPAPLRIKGGIVLVGQAVTGKADAGPSPRSAYAPLVLIQANLINNVLTGDFARRASPWLIWLGALALGYLGIVIGVRRTLGTIVAFTLLSLAVYGALAYAAWIKWSLWVPLVGPMLGFAGLQFVVIGRRVLQEQHARDQVKQMFGSYLAPQVVSRMIASGEAPRLGGHEAEITAYFSDIQDYSAFAEKLSPAQLVELLNEYLTACTDIVQEEGGTLDKYIGDAVVAMFGAPMALPDHAYRACVAALRVQRRLEELRQKWAGEGARWPEGVRNMRTRIGLNTGPAIIGNMGSRTRFNYTMTGDNVNLAARMESGAKRWGVCTMCTEVTKLRCEEAGGDRVVFRALGRIVVKGRTRPVPIYEMVGLKEDVSAETRECISRFEQGLDCYHSRAWEDAQAHFRSSAKWELRQPGMAGVADNPSLIYLELTERYRAAPPAAEWDGVHLMADK
jgi:adenylate cyclase